MNGAVGDDDLDLIAAEYVIGTLDAVERQDFAGRLAREPGARRAVSKWERRFAGLTDRLSPVTPPQVVWDRIAQAIATPGGNPVPFKVIEGGRDPDALAGLRRSRNRWRTGALLSGALAAALLVGLALKVLQPATEPDTTYVAAVNRGGDKPALIVRVNLKTGQVLVRPVAAVTPAGRSLELWYIGTDKTPRSMGVVPAEASNLALPSSSPTGNATFAVSVEPPGGSKTGGPTGPIVYAGQLVKE